MASPGGGVPAFGARYSVCNSVRHSRAGTPDLAALLRLLKFMLHTKKPAPFGTGCLDYLRLK